MDEKLNQLLLARAQSKQDLAIAKSTLELIEKEIHRHRAAKKGRLCFI